MIASIAGKNAQVQYIEKEKGDVIDTWADVTKAASILGWKAETNINEGLQRYLDYYHEKIEASHNPSPLNSEIQ